MKPAKVGGWLPHETAFAIFLGITAIRLLFCKETGIFWGFIFLGLLGFVIGLQAWATMRSENRLRQRIRLLAYVPLMLLTYKACGMAVPVFHPNTTLFLARADEWWLGQDAALFLEPWMQPRLTDLFYGLYLFFFIYLGISLWSYGRGNLEQLQSFITGLFTVYGVGFLGYTLLPAGGPYLELAGHFSKALVGGWITQVSTTLVIWGSNRVDCFPCLHFAVTFYILIFDYWHHRRRYYWMLLPCIGIWISTIYLRQHYAIDLFGGLALGLFALRLVNPEMLVATVIEKNNNAKFFSINDIS